MGFAEIKVDDILEGAFWQEPVRVLTIQPVGELVRLGAVGTRTQQFYSRIFTPADLARVRLATAIGRDFQGRGEALFLGVEGHRTRFAQQFDPLFAVNVSQVDPLPHQIEAVYHYILQNPRIRFLLADLAD